ncbi:ammonium transporter [Bacillus mojavensis]|nr:ammonium transporter [Bacillus mojavensis]
MNRLLRDSHRFLHYRRHPAADLPSKTPVSVIDNRYYGTRLLRPPLLNLRSPNALLTSISRAATNHSVFYNPLKLLSVTTNPVNAATNLKTGSPGPSLPANTAEWHRIFAGGTAVHINAGVAALAACLLLGKRKGYENAPMPAHNLSLTMVGAAMLWAPTHSVYLP